MSVSGKRVFLGGEGPTELGGWYAAPQSRGDSPERGVLEALLHRAATSPWTVGDAAVWRALRKYRAGGARRGPSRDLHNILALALKVRELRAREGGVWVLAFTRDIDKASSRADDVRKGVEEIEARGDLEVIGACAEPCIEGWVLAVLGKGRSEHGASSTAKQKLAEAVEGSSTARYVKAIEDAELGPAPRFDRIPQDAVALRAWLAKAASVL